MKHQDPEKLLSTAEILPVGPEARVMSRQERLERWADLLEAHRGELNALREIEYLPLSERRAYWGPNTPMTVAYGDPVLRSAGLAGDTLGDAMDFFGMSSRDAHRLLCDCHYRGTMSGPGLAYHIRRYALSIQRGGFWSRAYNMLMGYGF